MRQRWVWAGLVAVHVALVVYFFGGELPLQETPMAHGDFSTHAAQVDRVLEGLEVAGRAWVYDTQLLAGAPNGVLFDADNKGWEVWTWALVRSGAPKWWAFNAFPLVVHLLLPLVIYASARLFGLERVHATTAMGSASAMWFFDSYTHWMWFVGTISYAFVAYLSLLALALFYRWTERRRPRHALGCAVVLALGHLVHPYVFFILVVPMSALWIRVGFVERSLKPWEHGIVLAIAGVTVGANAWWLLTALRFFHYVQDSAYYGQAGVELIFFELLGLVHRVDVQGTLSPRTSVRLLMAIAAVVGLVRWRRTAQRQRLPLLALIATMACIAYLGSYTPLRQIQPFRHALPLGFALCIVAGAALPELVRARPWRRLEPVQAGVGAVLLLLSCLHVMRDVSYFFGGSMDDAQVLPSGVVVPISTTGHLAAHGFRYGRGGDFDELVELVERRDEGLGRWLIQDADVGEGLMARTDAQVLGGFLFRNLEHADANWFRHRGLNPPYDLGRFAAYLETYAVRWILIYKKDAHPWWDAHPQLWAREGTAHDMLLYRVLRPSSLLDGPGRAEASVNRIEVVGSDPGQDTVLRFHWMETLVCRPSCALEREPVAGDRVGFIRVPAPHPADFVVEHVYPTGVTGRAAPR